MDARRYLPSPLAILGPSPPPPAPHLVGSLSHELLGRLFPNGRHCDDPSDIRVFKVRACLVTQLLKVRKIKAAGRGALLVPNGMLLQLL
jgi:hypothetical protein